MRFVAGVNSIEIPGFLFSRFYVRVIFWDLGNLEQLRVTWRSVRLAVFT